MARNQRWREEFISIMGVVALTAVGTDPDRSSDWIGVP